MTANFINTTKQKKPDPKLSNPIIGAPIIGSENELP